MNQQVKQLLNFSLLILNTQSLLLFLMTNNRRNFLKIKNKLLNRKLRNRAIQKVGHLLLLKVNKRPPHLSRDTLLTLRTTTNKRRNNIRKMNLRGHQSKKNKTIQCQMSRRNTQNNFNKNSNNIQELKSQMNKKRSKIIRQRKKKMVMKIMKMMKK